VTRLLVFDSGIGGLSVARAIRQALPGAEIVYVADDAGFPYGDWAEPDLTEHVVTLIGGLIHILEPAAVVVACNTASTLVLQPLRALHSVPFVGTVPAIKPAAARTQSGHVSVLGTFGTMQREYTRALIQQFAGNCNVRLVGSANLAPLAEAYMRGEAIDDAAVWAEIEPAFVERDGARTDVVVLACTHYPFLIEHFERLAPWPVAWIDPALAIARQVAVVAGAASGQAEAVRGHAYLTSGRTWSRPVARVLDQLGLSAAVLPGVAKERT
jgi:glutamate racemase